MIIIIIIIITRIFIQDNLSVLIKRTVIKKFLFLFLNSDTVVSDSIQKISPAFDKLDETE